MQPRVLIVTTEAPDIFFSGLSFFNQEFWAELKRRNYPFKVLYLNNQKTRPSQLADYEVIVEPALPFDSSFESLVLNVAWSTSQKIAPILKEFNPDVISVHENTPLLPFYFELERVQFTLHSSYIGMQHYLTRTQKGMQNYWEQRIAVRQSGALILHSNWAHRSVIDFVSADSITPNIFPIGVDFTHYPTKKIHHPEGKIVISFFGRFTDIVKNFYVFRDAINTLPSSYRNRVEARVYGPEKIPDYLVNEGFKGLTFVQGEDKKQALAETDIVVFPSIQESYGIVGLEALLSNCALIATPGLGMDSYMKSEYSCESTVSAIQNKIIGYLSNVKKLRSDQAENTFRNSVNRSEFTLGKMTESYIKVWKELYEKNLASSFGNK